jgi:hypothetical protein
VSFYRDALRPEPVGRFEDRVDAATGTLGTGTLACPLCDAPVALGKTRLSVREPLFCPYCHHTAPVRDFLSLATPARPARVAVRVVLPARLVT